MGSCVDLCPSPNVMVDGLCTRPPPPTSLPGLPTMMC